ncbi:MAG: GNAT family N-acetyltransferase [Proteobacteria bacterium]|nr:GNAT family N-acetyltransferase [Pseudomonadota bacterium]
MTDLPTGLAIHKLDGKRDLTECFEIRRAVFIEEQQVPRDTEQDGLDVFYTHYLLKEGGKPIGTARAKVNAMNEGKMGRFCLVVDARKKGYGKALMEYILADLKKNDKNLKKVQISAETVSMPFFEKLGFAKIGDEYQEANIPHFAMVWTP